jgi:hypothetical protein
VAYEYSKCGLELFEADPTTSGLRILIDASREGTSLRLLAAVSRVYFQFSVIERVGLQIAYAFAKLWMPFSSKKLRIIWISELMILLDLGSDRAGS